jgi:protein ImuB
MFAVLHLADFALHAVLRNAPATRNAPAALFSASGKKSVVLAANAAARAAGVGRGMTAPQAVARCTHLLICSPSASAETEARAALFAASFALSPAIEDTAHGICTIDLRGVDPKKIPPALSLAVAQLARLGLPATAGLARTPLLALYAARAATLVLTVADEKSFLAPLPLATADPPPELAGVLAQWGLRTLGDLTALPRDEIVRRFGAAGLALWQRASGGEPRPLRPVVPPREFSATMEFEQEIETLEPLLFILRRFLDRLALELVAAQLVAADLELALRLEDDTTHTRRFRLPEPTADPGILFRSLHTHLESLHTAASIARVDLRIMPARPLVRQQGLFETGLRDPHGFAETLARLSALVGADRVGTPQLEDTHRPDAVKLAPPTTVIPPPVSAPLHPPLGLPLRRFRPPLPAKLEFTAGRPTYLWTENFHGPLASLHGPWPGSGDWWQADRAWRRTEWDVALEGGGLYRLLHTDEAYFIEGEYD